MHVVLGVGGSEDSMVALRETVERIHRTGDDLTIALLENPATDRDRSELEETVAAAVADAGIDAPITHLEGDPGPALTDFAEAGSFDRIVLGGGKRSPMGKIALGQVAEFVLLNADTSVTLIR